MWDDRRVARAAIAVVAIAATAATAAAEGLPADAFVTTGGTLHHLDRDGAIGWSLGLGGASGQITGLAIDDDDASGWLVTDAGELARLGPSEGHTGICTVVGLASPAGIFGQPTGLASHGDPVWISTDQGMLHEVSATGAVLRTFTAHGCEQPVGVGVDPVSGDRFCLGATGALVRYDDGGAVVATFDLGAICTDPVALHVEPGAAITAAFSASGMVTIVDVTGNVPVVTSTVSTGLVAGGGIAIGSGNPVAPAIRRRRDAGVRRVDTRPGARGHRRRRRAPRPDAPRIGDVGHGAHRLARRHRSR